MASRKEKLFQTAFEEYRAIEVIGQGGAGTVYRVMNGDGELWAIKVLTGNSSRKKLKRFRNELMFCMRNSHDGIIRVLDHGLSTDGKNSAPFYVMPLYEGSLRALMKTGINIENVLQYFSQILDSVEAAHLLKVFHRDIKPENFLYNKGTDRLVLADFGIAHFHEENLHTAVETKADERLANFQYAAPEQRTQGRSVDHRADIFALGLILNELFTGHVPHGEGYRTIGSLHADYIYLDELVARMIQNEPEKRLQSIEEIKQQLIGRKHQFVSPQRLSTLREKVVHVTDVDDPLVADPPQIRDVDWAAGRLTITLSRPVNKRWHAALRNIGDYKFAMDVAPERFVIQDDRAMISVDGHRAQAAIDYFKQWLPKANAMYEALLRRDLDAAQREERRKLEEQIREEEERHKIVSRLKI